MNILTMPQRSPEWFAARAGCLLTASAMGPFLTKKDGRSREARQNLICRKLCSRLPDDEWTARIRERDERVTEANLDVQRGLAWEELARADFARHTGSELAEVGLILSDDGLFGASADALVRNEDGQGFYSGLEVKCPRREVLVAYHLKGAVLPDECRGQVHGSMVVTGLRQWDFWAWHEGLPPFHVEVRWDDFTERMAAGLRKFAGEFREAEARLARAARRFERKEEG